MDKLPRVVEDRIRFSVERFVQPLIYRNKIDMKIEAAEVGGEPISYEEAIKLSFEPFEDGRQARR